MKYKPRPLNLRNLISNILDSKNEKEIKIKELYVENN